MHLHDAETYVIAAFTGRSDAGACKNGRFTIDFGDISSEKLSQTVHYLGGSDFHWEISVDNVALIYDNGTRQVIKVRYELGTGRRYL